MMQHAVVGCRSHMQVRTLVMCDAGLQQLCDLRCFHAQSAVCVARRGMFIQCLDVCSSTAWPHAWCRKPFEIVTTTQHGYYVCCVDVASVLWCA
jgi:hypothetical protein